MSFSGIKNRGSLVYFLEADLIVCCVAEVVFVRRLFKEAMLVDVGRDVGNVVVAYFLLEEVCDGLYCWEVAEFEIFCS